MIAAAPKNIGLFNYLHLDTLARDTVLEIILWLWSSFGQLRNGLSEGALENAFTQWVHHRNRVRSQGRNGLGIRIYIVYKIIKYLL